LELKHLSKASIPAALAKAERYRLLNEPWEAESIYQDVLDADPDNQEAAVGLLLAITDGFGQGHPRSVDKAQEVLHHIHDEYQRAYYAGIILERRAKALVERSRIGSAAMARDLLEQAKRCYDQAEAIRPPDNDDALLRWNACTRLLSRFRVTANSAEERYEPYSD